ncbi:hypothetical protein [Kitasatospora sp. NPDC093806]|uniref:hypothetical protein n=1 Tax=Kitasatospora sp. NPDC093806 TaxID=3155075 RepID=UPI00343A2F26
MHEISRAGGEDEAPREDGNTAGGAAAGGAARADAPKADVSKTDVSRPDVSKTDTPKTDTPKSDATADGAQADVPEKGDGGAAEPPRGRRAPERSQAEQDEIFAALVAQFDDPVDLNNPNWPEIENLRARGELKGGFKDGTDRGPGEPGDLADLAPQPRPRSGRPVMPAADSGPRDFELTEDPDEGHFVPPEPPPLPEADTTAKFAWLAVLGGPALLLFDAVVWREVSGWPAWIGVAAFLGGFATLVVRMKDRDEDEPEDPHGGAVV